MTIYINMVNSSFLFLFDFILCQTVDDLKEKLHDAKDQVASLTKKAKDALILADSKANEVISVINENDHLSASLKQCESDLGDLQEQCRSYGVTIDRQELQIKSLEEELRKHREMLKEQARKDQEKQTQLDSLNTQCASYTERINALVVEKNKANSNADLAESLLAKTEISLGDKIKTLDDKLSQQLYQSVETSSQLAVVKVNLKESLQRIALLEKDNDAKENERKALERSLFTATNEAEKANETIANLEGRLASALHDIKDMVNNNSRYLCV